MDVVRMPRFEQGRRDRTRVKLLLLYGLRAARLSETLLSPSDTRVKCPYFWTAAYHATPTPPLDSLSNVPKNSGTYDHTKYNSSMFWSGFLNWGPPQGTVNTIPITALGARVQLIFEYMGDSTKGCALEEQSLLFFTRLPRRAGRTLLCDEGQKASFEVEVFSEIGPHPA